MINKKDFDLILQEIFRIENKIVEIKILNQFDKANEYEIALEKTRSKAKDIVLDNSNNSEEFDDISLEVILELVELESNIDYYILKTNNIIESAIENRIEAEALEKLKKMWADLEEDIKNWNKSNHNPIEDIEYNKYVGKTTFDIIIYQLQTQAIIDFSRIFKTCKKEYLENTIKEYLYQCAKEETEDEIRRRMLVNLAKNISEKDLYDYKLWQQLLKIKDVRSRDDHIEMIGNYLEQENRKYVIDENSKNNSKNLVSNEERSIDIYDEGESLFETIKNWFKNFNEVASQNQMAFNWANITGPAFKAEFEDGNVKYAKDYLDKNTIKKVKKLTIATNGVGKYNFEKNAKWESLEELEFLEKEKSACVNLSSDRTYNCIGNEAFADCEKLKNISFGKIEMIGERAFKNCANLTDITFSKSIINVGEDAFLNCKNLKRVTFLGDLKVYILDRPQNIINSFEGTALEEITFSNLEIAFNFAIIDCPNLKNILVSGISNMKMPFKTCKYKLGRQEGIISFIGEKALNLWKKRNKTIRFFELTEEDKRKFKIN